MNITQILDPAGLPAGVLHTPRCGCWACRYMADTERVISRTRVRTRIPQPERPR